MNIHTQEKVFLTAWENINNKLRIPLLSTKDQNHPIKHVAIAAPPLTILGVAPDSTKQLYSFWSAPDWSQQGLVSNPHLSIESNILGPFVHGLKRSSRT